MADSTNEVIAKLEKVLPCIGLTAVEAEGSGTVTSFGRRVSYKQYVYRGLWDAELVQIKTFNRFNLCWAWGHASQKASTPNCPPRHLHVVPLWKLSAWWTTEFSPVYANPTSLNKEEEGRMVKDTDAGDGVSVKTPGGRQRETTSLLFPRIWLVR